MLSLLIACVNEPAVVVDDSAVGVETSDYQPTWTYEQAAAEADALLIQGILMPDDVVVPYLEFMEHASGGCPAAEDPVDFQGWWDDDCVTDDGYGFYGKSMFAGFLAEGYGHVAGYTLIRPDGSRLVGAGGASKHGLDGFVDLGGVFWDSASDGLHGELIDAGLQVTKSEDGVVVVAGGFALGSGGGLHFADVQTGETCESAPDSGELRIREPSGLWWSLVFDDCAACGTLGIVGEPHGEVCLAQQVFDAVSAAGEGML